MTEPKPIPPEYITTGCGPGRRIMGEWERRAVAVPPRADRAGHAAGVDRGASGAGGCVVSRPQSEALRTLTERVVVLERECAHARMHLSDAAEALGPIWIGPDDTLADGIRAKVAMLEGLINE